MQEWTSDDMTYQINSMYLVSEDAWTYELTGPRGTPGAAAALAVVIPDATPDGEQFTPADATHAYVTFTEGPLPWPVLLRFIHFVETSGDIVSVSPTATAPVTGDLSLSLNSWRFASRDFEVTSCQPADGPFTPAPAWQVTVAGHGSTKVPWPIFLHFLNAISASGDIVDDQARLN